MINEVYTHFGVPSNSPMHDVGMYQAQQFAIRKTPQTVALVCVYDFSRYQLHSVS
jgi:hypothetical protein